MTEEKQHIVIIGGGFAGINAAKQLKNTNNNVTIIDKNNHHLFQPLLYQVATAAISPGDIATPIRGLFGKRAGFDILLAEVDSINKQENSVTLTDGRTIDFDQLIVATGSEYNYFGNDEWANYAPGLKSISDALDVRERILLSLEKADQLDDPDKRRPYLTFVIIGGGPTGVETAGAIAEIVKYHVINDYSSLNKEETRIFLVEAMSGILNGYPDSLSKKAQKTLEDMGVQVMLNAPVNKIEKGKVILENDTIETPNMLWAAGVAATDLVNSLGAEQDRTNRVKVTKQLTLPDHPNIFVIGDTAYFEQEGHPLPALAPVAIQQGKYVGKLLASGTDPSKADSFHYSDKGTMATIGRAKAVAKIAGLEFSGFIAWIIWVFVHIFTLVGFRNRARIFGEWIWLYLTFNRGVRLITSRYSERDRPKGIEKKREIERETE
jgi:NADH dehydrogenase